MRPYWKNNQIKKGWRHSSSGRVPPEQVQVPEFKPKYHRNKQNIISLQAITKAFVQAYSLSVFLPSPNSRLF
jgi:hypothetical protein